MPDYHEPVEELKNDDRDFIRALYSMKEEIEAIVWYHQRVATCSDEHLKKLLIHNRDEEMEHASMLLEWLRRSMSGWDEQLRQYLFTSGDLTDIEEENETGEIKETIEKNEKLNDLGIGSLKDQ